MDRSRIFQVIDRAGIFLVLVALLVLLGIVNPSFRHPENLLNILQQSTPMGIAAVGMTFVIISGAFDLSVGSLMALTACVLVSLIDRIGFYPALLVALSLGLFCGLINGIIITRAGISPFIVTLGTLWVYRALAYIYTRHSPVQSADASFISWGDRLVGVPKLFIVMIVFYILGYLVLHHTPFGRAVFALGSNPRAAVLSGIPVLRVRVVVFGLVGLFGALGGAMLSVRLWSAKASTAMGYELMIISAVVLGGTSLKGGTGTLFGTLGATLLFTLIYNAMDMFQVQSYWQKIALGVILLLALSLDGLRERFGSNRSRIRKAESTGRIPDDGK